jgi:hypothetical protein
VTLIYPDGMQMPIFPKENFLQQALSAEEEMFMQA